MFPVRPDDSAAQAPRHPRILAQITLTVFALLAGGGALAQGVRYSVQVEAPEPLDELLENNLDLVRWRDNPRLDRDQLLRLVKSAPEQVRTLVATEGYYTPKVSAGLDERGAELVARVMVDPGPPVLVGDVDLVLQGFGRADAAPADAAAADPNRAPFNAAALRNRWTLPVGSRFRHADWESAKRNLLRQVMQTRYPRAQLVESSATVDPQTQRALLRVVLDSGPEARFGSLRIEGLKRYSPAIITNLNQIRPGDEYNEPAMQAFQARLQDTGYFSGVEVSADTAAILNEEIDTLSGDQAAAPKPAPAGPVTLPLVVRVTENKERNVAVGLGYSTNTGNRAQLAYDDLNVLGLRMKSNLIYETLRQSARADFFFPTTKQGYNDSFGAGFERTDVRGELLDVATVAARRSWGSPLLERSIALEYLSEQRTVANLEQSRSQSLPLTYTVTRRALDNLVVPTTGYVINAQIGGALLPVLTDERFVRATARFINYRPLSPASTLILRAEAGALASKQKAGVPSTFLFRAGGDQSVRGYGYQQLGVQEGTAIVGARYLLTGSAEYQYWFKPPWGAAVFYDAGNAADSLKDLKPKSGYGVGARWRSPVGPINVDVAYGQAVKKVRFHFSLGFTF
jgi:translocation and assembly module TamA